MIRKLIYKMRKRRFCKLNGWFCPDCIYHDFIFEGAVFRGNRCRYPRQYVINPQEPTNDDKCFECDDFFTCGGQCNKIEGEPQTDDLQDWKDRMWAEAIVTEPTSSKMEQVDKDINVRSKDEPQLTPNYCGTCKHREVSCGDLPCDVCHGYSNYEPKDEPQTDGNDYRL